jgi:hypothetical protein
MEVTGDVESNSDFWVVELDLASYVQGWAHDANAFLPALRRIWVRDL